MKPVISASSLWRTEKCPASATLPQFRHTSAAAERGRELHAAKETAEPEGAEIAYAFDVTTLRARMLGKSLDRNYPTLARTEIAGTTDKETIEPDRVIVRDYKSGFGYEVPPAAQNIQLGFYAVCAADVHGKDAARVELEFLDQDGRIDAADLDALDLVAIRQRIREIFRRATAPNPQVVVGKHCAGCPAIANCPAQRELALVVATGKLPAELPTLELSRDAVAAGWPKLMAFKKLLGEVERIYRAYASTEPVPLGDGRWLGPVTKRTEELDGAIAANVLRELHGSEVVAQACEISTSKAAIERALAPLAARGQKAGMMRRVLDHIAAAGGIQPRFRNSVEEYDEETST